MRILVLLAAAGLALTGRAYDFMMEPPLRWPAGEIRMYLELDSRPIPVPLTDGHTSWDAIAREGLGMWNAVVSSVQFGAYSAADRWDGNDRNEVFFASSVYGQRFGNGVLAVTTAWRIGTERIEGDTIFNSAIDWDSYRGPLDYDVIDFRRVAIHEFGHTLGLDHPDEAGQHVAAIMNSRVSNVEMLTDDDMRGARALYGGATTRYRLGVSVLPPVSGAVYASPYAPDGAYTSGTLLRLVARPERGFRFNFWKNEQTGEAKSGRTMKFRIYEDTTLTALFVSNAAPRIVVAPRSRSVSEGFGVTFQVRATGKAPLTFQWQKDSVDLLDETNTVLLLPEVAVEDAGMYSVIVRNPRGETPSKPARLIVDGF